MSKYNSVVKLMVLSFSLVLTSFSIYGQVSLKLDSIIIHGENYAYMPMILETNGASIAGMQIGLVWPGQKLELDTIILGAEVPKEDIETIFSYSEEMVRMIIANKPPVIAPIEFESDSLVIFTLGFSITEKPFGSALVQFDPDFRQVYSDENAGGGIITTSDGLVQDSSNLVNIEVVEAEANYIEVFPNPIANSFQVKGFAPTELLSAKIIDNLGREIWSNNITSNSIVSLPVITTGTYWLIIVDSDNKAFSKTITITR